MQEQQLPSIASLRAIAALRNRHLALVRPARIGLGFEPAGAKQRTLAEIEDVLGGPGRLSLPYSLRWLLDVLSGLGVLHRGIGFVHGEVQPEHIVLGDDGIGKLIPVVRPHWVRGEDRSAGRLYYLAPEKLLGDAIDVRCDVFSMGVMLWEAIAGQQLFEVDGVGDIIARLMSGGIPLAQAPEGEAWTVPLAHVAAQAISVDPARRFANVAEMKEAIEGICLRYLASPPGMADMLGDPLRRARVKGRDSSIPAGGSELSNGPSAEEIDALEAAAERLARSSVASIEEEAGSFSAITTDNGSEAFSTPASTVARLAPVPSRVLTPLGPYGSPSSAPPEASFSAPPEASFSAPPEASFSAPPEASFSAPFDSDRQPLGVSLAPLIAARALDASRGELSLGRRTPRAGRGMLWVLLGAGAAVAGLAARPWIVSRVGGQGTSSELEQLPEANTARVTPTSQRPVPSVHVERTSSPVSVGIASTPASPEPALKAAASARAVARNATSRKRLKPLQEPSKSVPEGPSPTSPAPETPLRAVPAPRAVPVSEAERYGI